MTQPNPSDLTTQIWALLNRTQRALSGHFETELKRAGLPSARWYDVLWGLERKGDEHGLRQYELEALGLFDQPNLSRTLKQMNEQGLVTQEYAQNDKRGRVLHITQKGRELRARMWQVYGNLMLTEIEQKVDPKQAVHLVAALRTLHDQE